MMLGFLKQDMTQFLLLIVIGYTSVSCKKSEYRTRGEFIYINSTNALITIKNIDVYRPNQLESYQILPNDTLILFREGESPSKKADERNFSSPIGGDTVVVIFNDSSCKYEIGTRINGHISNIHSYISERVSDLSYKFYMTIDSNRLNSSLPCI